MLYEEMRRMEHSHRCTICHAPLVTIWAGTEHRLVCGQDRSHEGYEPRPTAAQEYQERERQMQEERPPLNDGEIDFLFK